jgi:amino acid transporter
MRMVQPILTDSQVRQSRLAAMSVWDGFIYNFLAMGVIFPWLYLWGPAVFPGASISLAIVLAFLAQVPLSVAYSFAANAMPGNAGDYVYQKRAFGRWAGVVVLSGFVIWILQWLALSGWLLATLGLSPLFLSFAAGWNSKGLTLVAIMIESPGGVFIISCALSLATVLLLKRGLRVFAQVQRVLFVLLIGSIGAIVFVFTKSHTEVSAHLTHFVDVVAGHLTLQFPKGMRQDFLQFLKTDVQTYGYAINRPFSFFATLGVMPIAWTSLQWATYSVEQNAEIEGSDRLKNQLLMLVGSAAAVAFLLVLVAYLEAHALGTDFLRACSGAYWSRRASPEVYLFVRNVLQPFPNALAIASSEGYWATIVIALGFIANALQVTCNSFIGMAKIIVKMDEDGLFPDRWKLSQLDLRTEAPMRAYWLYFFLGVPVIFGYSLIPKWGEYTLGVTFASGYVFMMSALAIAKLTFRPSSSNEFGGLAWIPTRVLRVSACLGAVAAGAMTLSYLVVPKLGLTGVLPYCIVAFIFLACALWVFLRSPGQRGIPGETKTQEQQVLPASETSLVNDPSSAI